MAHSHLSSRSERQIGEEAEILLSPSPPSLGLSWPWPGTGDPVQVTSKAPAALWDHRAAWGPCHQTQELQGLQICCQLQEGEQFHHPWSLNTFFKERILLFDDWILFSKAGVEAVGITMGKNKKEAFYFYQGSLLQHIFASL